MIWNVLFIIIIAVSLAVTLGSLVVIVCNQHALKVNRSYTHHKRRAIALYRQGHIEAGDEQSRLADTIGIRMEYPHRWGQKWQTEPVREVPR